MLGKLKFIAENYSNSFNTKRLNAFSLAEIMISLLIISIILAATMPILVQSTWTKNGIDKYAMSCILSNATDIGYDVSGDTTMPSSTSSNCYQAISGCEYNKTQ